MTDHRGRIMILLADDDPDDRMLAKEALEENCLASSASNPSIPLSILLLAFLERAHQNAFIVSPLHTLWLLNHHILAVKGRHQYVISRRIENILGEVSSRIDFAHLGVNDVVKPK